MKQESERARSSSKKCEGTPEISQSKSSNGYELSRSINHHAEVIIKKKCEVN